MVVYKEASKNHRRVNWNYRSECLFSVLQKILTLKDSAKPNRHPPAKCDLKPNLHHSVSASASHSSFPKLKFLRSGFISTCLSHTAYLQMLRSHLKSDQAIHVPKKSFGVSIQKLYQMLISTNWTCCCTQVSPLVTIACVSVHTCVCVMTLYLCM